jgi:hypothetical protein
MALWGGCEFVDEKGRENMREMEGEKKKLQENGEICIQI